MDSLRDILIPLIQNQIISEGIDFHHISGRVKDRNSYLEKVERKGYKNPILDVTDFCGIRIITFFPSQVFSISKLLRDIFEIDEGNSTDKIQELGDSKVGYQSVHLVGKLGATRKYIPEYKNLADLQFEIQIRTILQHAWAELVHDGSYKFSGELPPKLQRKLNLQAGALELVDEQLEEISQSIKDYEVEIEASKEKRDSEGLNALSLERLYLDVISQEKSDQSYSTKGFKNEIRELRDFGVQSIGELSTFITEDLRSFWQSEESTTPLGFVRQILMEKDIEKYFESSYNDDWSVLDAPSFERLSETFGQSKVIEILDKHGIEIETDFD